MKTVILAVFLTYYVANIETATTFTKNKDSGKDYSGFLNGPADYSSGSGGLTDYDYYGSLYENQGPVKLSQNKHPPSNSHFKSKNVSVQTRKYCIAYKNKCMQQCLWNTQCRIVCNKLYQCY